MTQFGSNTYSGSDVAIGIDPGFNPLWFSGCVAWFDMQDPRSYVVTSGAVSDITNKASGVVWSQATAGARPPFNATKLNGFPCMDGDGSNDIIISTEAAVVAAMTNSPALTIFGVVQADAPDSSTYWFSAGTSLAAGLNNSRGFGINTTGTGNYLAGAQDSTGGAHSLQSAASTGTGNPITFEYFTDGATGSIVINGGTPDPNNSAQAIGTLTPNQCGIGGAARQTPNACFDGAVGEILVFNRQLTDFERAVVRTYLLRKWGLADPTPLTILGSLAWWVRADLGIAQVTGVSQWDDLSGNGRHFTQATTGNQPALITNAINGRPAVRGDGSNDQLNNTFARVAPGTQPFYVSLIMNQVTWALNDWIWADFNTTGAGLRCRTGTPELRTFDANHVAANSAATVGTYVRAEMQFSNAASDYLKIASTNSTGSTAGNDAGAGGVTLFSTASSGGASNAEIAEAFWFVGTPTAAQRAWLDAYFYLLYGPTLGL